MYNNTISGTPFSVAVPEIVFLYMQLYTVLILSLPPFSVAVPEIVLLYM
jgi:hypothetical protein